MTVWRILSPLLLLLVLLSLNVTEAEPIRIVDKEILLSGKLEVLSEQQDVPLTLFQAHSLFNRGEYKQINLSDLTFGIGARPTWLHLVLRNPSSDGLARRLTVGKTWIDKLDVYHLDDNSQVTEWKTGDTFPHAAGVVSGVGYTFDIMLSLGRNDLFIRAETDDPMVLPIDLMTREQAIASDTWMNITYGVLYGLLLALIAYNIMFYVGFKRPRYLYYSIYVTSFIITNIAYTGQGFVWLWPEYPEFQRYIILVMMVIYSCCGLLFAAKFLNLKDTMPRAYLFVQAYTSLGLGGMAVCLFVGSQLAAAWWAFIVLTAMAVIMVGLGVLNVRQLEGRYFLVAASISMFGILLTALSVWSIIPFSELTYHSAEIGIVIEAVLLAFVLGKKVRSKEKALLKAMYYAANDPLTGLYNRRSFIETAGSLWSIALRNKRPLSLVMIDIDLFKHINDRFGHGVGDQVLVKVSKLLLDTVRDGDVLARWGGEEIILLLPETACDKAVFIAERLRSLIESSPILVNGEKISMTASFGVVEQNEHTHLEKLIEDADKLLYAAKQAGRNRVETMCIGEY